MVARTVVAVMAALVLGACQANHEAVPASAGPTGSYTFLGTLTCDGLIAMGLHTHLSVAECVFTSTEGSKANYRGTAFTYDTHSVWRVWRPSTAAEGARLEGPYVQQGHRWPTDGSAANIIWGMDMTPNLAVGGILHNSESGLVLQFLRAKQTPDRGPGRFLLTPP